MTRAASNCKATTMDGDLLAHTASDLPGRGARHQCVTRVYGFTLIELMVVVVIVAILAAIVYPSYQDSVRKSRRAEAKALLNDAAARQEQYFTQNKQYASTLTALGITNPDSPGGWYRLSAPAVTTVGGQNVAYTLRADPRNAQTADTRCGSFTLTSTGVRGATGTAPTTCW